MVVLGVSISLCILGCLSAEKQARLNELVAENERLAKEPLP